MSRAIEQLIKGGQGPFVIGATLPGRDLDTALLRAYELALGRRVRQDMSGPRFEQFTYKRTRKTATAVIERSRA